MLLQKLTEAQYWGFLTMLFCQRGPILMIFDSISCFGGDIKEGCGKCIYAMHTYVDVLILQ